MPADKPTPAGAGTPAANSISSSDNNKPVVELNTTSGDNNVPIVQLVAEPSTSSTTATTTTTNKTTKTQQQQQQPPDSQGLDPPASGQELAFLECLIDDVIYGECLQVHRAAKMGYIFTEPGDEMYQIKDGSGLDVFGQSLARPKKSMLCTCPQCNRNIAASRLAPHLEKCMGMGRLSARAASSKQRGASDGNNL